LKVSKLTTEKLVPALILLAVLITCSSTSELSTYYVAPYFPIFEKVKNGCLTSNSSITVPKVDHSVTPVGFATFKIGKQNLQSESPQNIIASITPRDGPFFKFIIA
jgi:hypothetical protein